MEDEKRMGRWSVIVDGEMHGNKKQNRKMMFLMIVF